MINVCLRYREGLPLVLDNVTLSIKSKEKIGIVGRQVQILSYLILYNLIWFKFYLIWKYRFLLFHFEIWCLIFNFFFFCIKIWYFLFIFYFNVVSILFFDKCMIIIKTFSFLFSFSLHIMFSTFDYFYTHHLLFEDNAHYSFYIIIIPHFIGFCNVILFVTYRTGAGKSSLVTAILRMVEMGNNNYLKRIMSIIFDKKMKRIKVIEFSKHNM